MPMVGDSLAQCRGDVDGVFIREWKLEVVSQRLFCPAAAYREVATLDRIRKDREFIVSRCNAIHRLTYDIAPDTAKLTRHHGRQSEQETKTAHCQRRRT